MCQIFYVYNQPEYLIASTHHRRDYLELVTESQKGSSLSLGGIGT